MRFAIFSLAVVILMNSASAEDVLAQPRCSAVSCGRLRDIPYPFQLRGDPVECGLPGYELVCSDNKAILYINQGKYYMTNISYVDDGNYYTFQVVDAGLVNSSCALPQRTLSPSVLYPVFTSLYLTPNLSYLTPKLWASFVNCSRMTKNSLYRPVPCLSQNNSFVYVLVAEDAFMIKNLEPSCRYLSMIPLGDSTMLEDNSRIDVPQMMKNGFALQSYVNGVGYSIFRHCTREANANFSEQMSNERSFDWSSAVQKSSMQYDICFVHYFHKSILQKIAPFVTLILLCIALATVSRFVFAPLIVFTFLVYNFFRTRMSVDAVEKFLRMQKVLTPTRYAYTDITAITSHFREKLGHGGYGSVFKGVLPGGVFVAIKMLANSKCNGEEFINEVSTIGRIHHVNVVRLVGFCSEGLYRALVYEYMPYGSLDKYIFSSERTFTWEQLNGIALGIARGINYLHRGCDMQILHFDIKPHNILLDHNFVPKIADFGLAKLYPKDHSLVSASAARGTIGYMAPEMLSRSFGVISCKSDVYSFGMLLMEMAGGRRNADPHAENSSQAYYPSWVYDRLTRQEIAGEISEIADICEVEKKLCMVGLWCIQVKSYERPMMSEVIEMLEGDVDALDMPPKPFFCGGEQIAMTDYSCVHFSSGLSIISEDD